MKKRGQVTTFMIIGLVIVIVVILIFALRQAGIGIDPQSYLGNKIDVIEREAKACTQEKLEEVSELIGKQGGTINPENYRMHNGYRVNYLCYNIPNAPECLNNMVFENEVEKEIEDYLNSEVPSCVDVESMSEQLLNFFPDIEDAEFESSVDIRENGVFVEVSYPVALKRGDKRVELKDFSELIDHPLGKLLDTTYDIVNEEANNGVFLSVPYMIANRGEVEIFVDQKEYPDKIYVLNERNSDYIFQFAIEGETG